MGLVAYFQQEMLVFQQNKHLAMPDSDTVKTLSWRMRHNETWILEKEPRQDMKLSRLSQNRDKNSSGDEIANVNFYVVRPEATRIRWNNAK